MWDGESPRLTPDGADEDRKHRWRPHIRGKLSSHGPFKHLKKEEEAPATSDKEEELSLPTPWTSASTERQVEPRVLHGYTLTKEVPFRDVCVAIRDAAFVNRYEIRRQRRKMTTK